MQDLISYLGIANKVCLVAVDFAGITATVNDLKNFVRETTSIKKVVIDLSPFGKSIKVYDRHQILANQKKLNEFNFRKGSLQKSK